MTRLLAATSGAVALVAVLLASRPGPPAFPAVPPSNPLPTCLEEDRPVIRLTGAQRAGLDRRRDVPAGTLINAAGATWEWGRAGSPVRVGGAPDICWHGGRLIGLYSDARSWADFHDTYALVGYGPGMVVEHMRAHNFGDGIKWLGPDSDDWTVRGVHLSHMHDDCVETDWGKGGRIEDVLFEGCYVFLATRPRSSLSRTYDGAGNTIMVDRAVVWMEPMATVYSGPSPSTGSVFKVDTRTPNRSPRMRLRRMVLRLDVEPGVGDACLNPGNLVVESIDNTVVWLGPGEYPCRPLPPGWTLSRDRSVYERAVAEWKSRRSEVSAR